MTKVECRNTAALSQNTSSMSITWSMLKKTARALGREITNQHAAAAYGLPEKNAVFFSFSQAVPLTIFYRVFMGKPYKIDCNY